ncbi:hypothetical protein LWI29_005506 [Acer saccharum]|uniref:TF-B3 domain-containing protein n=1 Tax=Acer saccharum TaxID=4024 RepID=A0AA39S8X2_ACESA|nr:hypothetical protein LWI29_005506 [Acer saccharum]
MIQVNLEEREEEEKEDDNDDHNSDDYDDSDDEDYNEEETTKEEEEDDDDDDDEATIEKSRAQKRSGGIYVKHCKSVLFYYCLTVVPLYVHYAYVSSSINEGETVDVSNFVQPRNPHFIAKLRTGAKKHLLHVPSKVLERHKLDLPDLIVFRNEQGKEWPGHVFRWNGGRTWISGWKALCKWNHVGLGDICICEFLPGCDG